MNDASGVNTGQRIGAIGKDVRTYMLLYYHNFRPDTRGFPKALVMMPFFHQSRRAGSPDTCGGCFIKKTSLPAKEKAG